MSNIPFIHCEMFTAQNIKESKTPLYDQSFNSIPFQE